MKNPEDLETIARLLGGVPIWGVLPGSAAHRAGMRYGDIVIRVNGIETPNFAQYLRAQGGRSKHIEFEVLRHGVLHKLDVEVDAPCLS